MSAKDNASVDDDLDKIAIVHEAEIPQSALNQLEPGTAGSYGRRHSTASVRSTRSWSSGKMQRAPDPPRSTSRMSAASSTLSMASTASSSLFSQTKKPPKQPIKERIRLAWKDPRKRKQFFLWFGFFVLVLMTLILVSVVVSRFTSGFANKNSLNGQATELDEDSFAEDWGNQNMRGTPYLYNSKKYGKIDLAEEQFILLIGGKDEERQDSCEILTRDGACHMVYGYPAPLPEGRIGHITAVVGDEAVFVCGGIRMNEKAITRQCWRLLRGTNEWVEVAALKYAVRYASATALGKDVYVLGGTDHEGQKTNHVQILNADTLSWRDGPVLPQPVWGHCAAATPDGVIVTTGGWTDRAVRSNMRNVFRTKPTAEGPLGRWSRLPSMKIGRATHGCTSTVYKRGINVVIVAGGMTAYHAPIATVEVLFLDANPRWVKLGEMIQPRSWYPAVGILRNRLVVLTGKDRHGLGTDSVEIFNPKTEEFQEFHSSLQWRRHDSRSALVTAKWFPTCIR